MEREGRDWLGSVPSTSLSTYRSVLHGVPIRTLYNLYCHGKVPCPEKDLYHAEYVMKEDVRSTSALCARKLSID
jgi:hypothetical protein